MFWIIVPVFLLSLIFTGIMWRYTLKRGVLDRPNARSAHVIPTPRGGGIAFVVVYLLMLCILYVVGPDEIRPSADLLSVTLVGGGCVALIGFMDDHKHVPIVWRFLVHFSAAVLATAVLGQSHNDPDILLFVLVAVAIVWILNLFNFMDGVDGIASVEAITVACGGALILFLLGSKGSEVFWLLALAAGVSGFLVWNWPPARIFMGDSASGFLGFILAIFAFYSYLHMGISLWSWVILLGIFVVDASWTLGHRILRGDRWYQAHSSHAYQILSRHRTECALRAGVDHGLARARGHRWVTLWVAAINIFWLFPMAWLAAEIPDSGPLIAAGALLPLGFVAAYLGAGRVAR